MQKSEFEFIEIFGKQLRSLDRLTVRPIIRSLRKSPRPDPTSDDHPRIAESVHRTNTLNLNRSNFNSSSHRNSPQSKLYPLKLHQIQREQRNFMLLIMILTINTASHKERDQCSEY